MTARPLDYAGRCARYLPQRGIAYNPWLLSVDRLTPRQRRRALKKERHNSPARRPDIDNDPYDGDDEDERCTHCDGEAWVECDDPVQCTYAGCDEEFHPDPACGGTGLARHQVMW